MTPEDQSELHRLCELLREVAEHFPTDSPRFEAISKAALGLSLAFIHGLRRDLDVMMLGAGQPLTPDQKEHLKSLGMDPDLAPDDNRL